MTVGPGCRPGLSKDVIRRVHQTSGLITGDLLWVTPRSRSRDFTSGPSGEVSELGTARQDQYVALSIEGLSNFVPRRIIRTRVCNVSQSSWIFAAEGAAGADSG